MQNNTIDAQIVLCGRGGQGVLFLTRLLGEAALALGNKVISSETHGMAMRGGSVASYIKIGGYHSPLIRSGEADILIALSESELPLYRHLITKGKRQIYLNSVTRKKGSLPADSIALALGSVLSVNLVMLGFACGHPEFPFTYEIMKDTLSQLSPSRVRDINIRALSEGYRAATQHTHQRG